MNFEDYYYILGVDRNASSSEIKNAFRKQAKKFHPDTNDGDKNCEDFFKKINNAYEVLKDENKRVEYNIKYDEHMLKEKEEQQRMYEKQNEERKRQEEANRRREEFRRRREERERQQEMEEEDLEFPSFKETFDEIKASEKLERRERRKDFSKFKKSIFKEYYERYGYDNIDDFKNDYYHSSITKFVKVRTRIGIAKIGREFYYSIKKLKDHDQDPIRYVLVNRKSIAAMAVVGTLVFSSIVGIGNDKEDDFEANTMTYEELMQEKDYKTVTHIMDEEDEMKSYDIDDNEIEKYVLSVPYNDEYSIEEIASFYETDYQTIYELNEDVIVTKDGIDYIMSNYIYVPDFTKFEKDAKNVKTKVL